MTYIKLSVIILFIIINIIPSSKVFSQDNNNSSASSYQRDYYFLFNNTLYKMVNNASNSYKIIPVPASTKAGALTLESAGSMLLRASDYPIDPLYDKTGNLTYIIMASKLILIDLPLSNMTILLNHYYSGNSVKVMESGSKIKKIEINPPIPFYWKSWELHYKYPHEVDDNIMITSGGTEANSVMSHEMSLRFVSDDMIFSQDMLLYISRMDIFLSINNASPPNYFFFNKTNTENYITFLNNKNGRDLPKYYRLKLGDLKKWSYITFADPFLYLSMFSYFNRFLGKKNHTKTYMIPISENVQFLPSTRLALTPWGPECYGDIYLKLFNSITVLTYIRAGDRTFNNSWGIGSRLYKTKIGKYIELGGGIDFFRQPELLHSISSAYVVYEASKILAYTRYSSLTPIQLIGELFENTTQMNLGNSILNSRLKNRSGIALYIDLSLNPLEYFKIHANLGYKTDGYVFGMNLHKGIFWHMGFGLYF